MAACAAGTSACPAAVSCTPRLLRRNSAAPTSASSCWIATVSGGWLRPRRCGRAAEVPLVGHGQKVAQVAQFHEYAVRMMNPCSILDSYSCQRAQWRAPPLFPPTHMRRHAMATPRTPSTGKTPFC
jgi:hypothetical protein